MLVLFLCLRLFGFYSDHLQAFLHLLQLPLFLRGITSHSPLPAKKRLPFALLNLHMAIIISKEKSANNNLNNCFSVEWILDPLEQAGLVMSLSVRNSHAWQADLPVWCSCSFSIIKWKHFTCQTSSFSGMRLARTPLVRLKLGCASSSQSDSSARLCPKEISQ